MDHSKIIASIALLLLAFTSCKRSVEVEIPDTDLVGEVRDKSNRPIQGVIVGIFDDEAAYKLASSTYDFSQALVKDTSDAKGEVKFAKLDASKRYYFFAYLEDKTTLPGQTIIWDNANLLFSIERTLTKGAVTYIRVTVEPTEGFITIWTNRSNESRLPIRLKLTNQQDRNLTTSSQNPPQPFGQAAVSYKLRTGTYKYQALASNSSCVWLDTVTVVGGVHKYVYLNPCTQSTVAFGATPAVANFLPIIVLLNGRDTLGTLNQVNISPTAVQSPCLFNSTAKSYLSPGQYSYKAVSPISGQIWTGIFEAKADSCKIISF